MSVTQYEVGSIVEGKITGLKPFGAFVALDEKNQGWFTFLKSLMVM